MKWLIVSAFVGGYALGLFILGACVGTILATGRLDRILKWLGC